MPTESEHAFLRSGGRMMDMGTLPGGGYSSGRAGAGHAFLRVNGEMRDLGTLGGPRSEAFGVNSSGEVVGESGIPDSQNAVHAFLYRSGRMEDLNRLVPSPGWILSTAYAINNRGQIVGIGLLRGEPHGFLLTR